MKTRCPAKITSVQAPSNTQKGTLVVYIPYLLYNTFAGMKNRKKEEVLRSQIRQVYSYVGETLYTAYLWFSGA